MMPMAGSPELIDDYNVDLASHSLTHSPSVSFMLSINSSTVRWLSARVSNAVRVSELVRESLIALLTFFPTESETALFQSETAHFHRT
jgi:hypothetical protein